MYGAKDVDGKPVIFGYSSVADWLDSVIASFPAPWRVGDLDGKYYGTEIFDAQGTCILSLWFSDGAPSARQKGDMTEDEWAEYCCDSHWESEIALRLSETIVNLRNLLGTGWGRDSRRENLLRYLVTELADWDTNIFEQVRAGGGPNKRPLCKDYRTMNLY